VLRLLKYPSISTVAPSTPFEARVERVAFARALEQFGPQQSFLRPWSLTEFTDQLRATHHSESQEEQLKTLLAHAFHSQYPGYQLMILSLGVTLSVFSFILLPPWGISVGYVWARTEGGIFGKLGVTLFITLLWPLSLVIFRFRRGRKGRSFAG
jgi:hypothetical protein